jgi:ETC complex I subunit conserved region
MHVLIHKPTKSAMQSGLARTKGWCLSFERGSDTNLDPLMGWWRSGDTRKQVQMPFETLEQAVAFAQRHGWSYEIKQDQTRRPVTGKSYSANFSTNRRGNWTH